MELEVFDARRERRRATWMGISLVILSAGTPVLYLLLAHLLQLIRPEWTQDRSILVWVAAAAQYGIGFPLTMAIMHRIPADPMEKRSWKPEQLVRCFTVLIFLMLIGVYLGYFMNSRLADFLGYMPADPVNDSLAQEDFLYTVITSVVLAPVLEELVMRRYLLDRINRWGDKIAMVISGLCFGLLHGNFYQFFYAFLIGCFLAWIYLRTAHIGYTIGLHLIFNLWFGVVSAWINELSGWQGSVLLGVYEALELGGAAAGLYVCIRYRYRFRLLKGWLNVDDVSLLRTVLFSPGMILFYIAVVVDFALFLG